MSGYTPLKCCFPGYTSRGHRDLWSGHSRGQLQRLQSRSSLPRRGQQPCEGVQGADAVPALSRAPLARLHAVGGERGVSAPVQPKTGQLGAQGSPALPGPE